MKNVFRIVFYFGDRNHLQESAEAFGSVSSAFRFASDHFQSLSLDSRQCQGFVIVNFSEMKVVKLHGTVYRCDINFAYSNLVWNVPDYQMIFDFEFDGGIDEGMDGYTTVAVAYSDALKKAHFYNLDRHNQGFVIIDKVKRQVVRQWGCVRRSEMFLPDSGYVWLC